MLITLLLLIILLYIMISICIMEYDLLKISNKKLDNAENILFLLKKWDNQSKEQKDFFEHKLTSENYNKIAVYGYGIIGRRIVKELEKSHIEVKYYIDKNAANIKADIPIFSNIEDLPEVDAIIVTVVSQFYEIKKILDIKWKYPIINIEDIL